MSQARQAITPQLRQWIVEQAQSGCSMQDVLLAMRKAGWQEDVAVQAMETVLSTFLDEQKQSQNPTAASAVPTIDWTDSPQWLDAGDRRVRVVTSLTLPRVVVLDQFLSDAECEELIVQAEPRLARSLTVETQSGGNEVNASRTSSGMFFRRAETPLIERIETRIARLLQWPVERGEGLQVLHYCPGAEYKPHYDYFDPDEPGTPTILKRGGQRVGTLVMYLNNPDKGGGTTFPDAQFEVAPRKGGAVFFSYDRPHPMTKTLHGGAPVISGEKWVATKWLRQGVFV